MANLREDVEALIPDLVDVLLGQAANYHPEIRRAQDDMSEADSEALDARLRSVAKFMLAKVFDRHPAADGVVTDSEVIAARQEFERKLRELCDSFGNEVHYETTGRMNASPASVNGKWAAIREFVRAYVFQSNKRAMAQARECDKRWAADGVVVDIDVAHD